MRNLALAAFVAVLSLVLQPSDALARRSSFVLPIFVFGQSDELICHQELQLTGDAGEQLCLAEYNIYNYLFAGIFTTSEVVLASKAGVGYYTLPSGKELSDFQQQGLLPSPIPNFKRPIIDYLHGYSLWLILLVVGTTVILVKIMNRGSEERKSPPDAEAVFNSALKCVMVSAMISDGEIREEERKTVAQIFNHITGSELNDADLDSIVTNILNNPQSVQTLLSRLSNSLTEDGKELLLKAAIMTVGSDGSLSEPEREFIATISSSLSLSSEQIEAILTSMRKPQEAAEAV